MPNPPDISGLKLTPYWWDAAPRPETDLLEVPTSADVAIIGAGFAGLTAALTKSNAIL